MLIEKKIMYKYLVLIFSFFISTLMIHFSNNIFIHIMSIFLMCIVSMFLVDFDLLHPYCWYSPFFTLYSTGHPIIISMGIPSKIGYSKESIFYQLVYLFIILIIITPKKYLYKYNKQQYELFEIDFNIFNKLFYMLLILIISLTSVYVYVRGFSGKAEIYESKILWLNIAFRLPLIITLFFTFYFIYNYNKHNKISWKLICLTGFSLLLLTLFSGERDFIFRYFMIIIFILCFFAIIKIKDILFVSPFIIFIFILSSSYKYYFTRGEISLMNKNLIYSILSGEFESANRNLQLLINNEFITKNSKGFQQIIFDLLSVINTSIDSPTSWFNKTFYLESKTKYGFTLVGEGYIIYGLIGIIVVSIILGILTRFFYKRAGNSIYTLSAYFYFSTTMIYAVRADLSFVFSAILKQILFIEFIIWIINKNFKFKIRKNLI